MELKSAPQSAKCFLGLEWSRPERIGIVVVGRVRGFHAIAARDAGVMHDEYASVVSIAHDELTRRVRRGLNAGRVTNSVFDPLVRLLPTCNLVDFYCMRLQETIDEIVGRLP